MIYLLCIYILNKIRKKKTKYKGAVDYKIRRLSKRGKRRRVMQATISAEQKPPSSDLH